MSSEAKAKFEWNNEVNFINIISALFNNWPEMDVSEHILFTGCRFTRYPTIDFLIFFFKLVVDRTSGDSRITVYTDIKKFIQDVFDCLLIYGLYNLLNNY